MNEPEEKIRAINASLEERVRERTRQLAESEMRYRMLYEGSPVSIWQEDWTRVIESINELRARGVSDFPAYFREHPQFVARALNDVKILDINEWTLRMFGAKNKADLLSSLETVFGTETTLPGFIGELCSLAQGEAVYRAEMALNTLKGDTIDALLNMTFPPLDSHYGEVLVSVLDITEQRKTEKALKTGEDRLRFFFERQLVGMAITSPKKGWLQVNEKLCQMLGYTREELAEVTWAEITYPDDLAADIAQFERMSRGEIEGYTLEKRFVRKDGSVVFTNLAVGCVRKANGSLDYVLAMLEDITERKRAEEALRNLNATLEEHIEQRTAELKTAITMLQTEVAERTRAEDELRRINRIYAVLSQVNQAVIRADSHERLLQQICEICIQFGGFKMAWVGTVNPQTRQVVPVASAGDERGYLNKISIYADDRPEGKGAAGTSIREARTCVSNDFLHDPDTLPWREAATESGLKAAIALPLRNQNQLYGTVVVYTDNPNYFHSREVHLLEEVASDISFALDHLDQEIRRKQNEEALKQAKASAEAANRAKDQFLAMLSHELRTPLTPVVATLSELNTQEELPGELQADMEMILRNVQMEVKLIDDLLDITRISRGAIDLHPEVVDACLLLQSALGICQKDVDSKHLDISLSFQAKTRHIRADPTRMRQVFWNLIKNAVAYTPEGGRITLRTSNADDQLKIEIEDTGIGIRSEVLPKIFQPFERGNHATSPRRFGGLGLGLSIAKSVVELHHGTITVSSQGLNQGATFTVKLPLATPAEPPQKITPPPVMGEAAKKLLLVEDHPDTLLAMSKLLRKWGYALVTADCVQAALERLSSESFDVLISDLGLPDGSGLEIMHAAKNRPNIKGISLSGYGTDDDIRNSLEAGFLEHLVKPISAENLRHAVQRAASPRE